MFKWLFLILIYGTSGKYQNKEKPLIRQKKLGLILPMLSLPGLRGLGLCIGCSGTLPHGRQVTPLLC